ncbi:MAG: AlwI family type II restriction endonuclease [Clostridiaceae bacterium]
MHERKAERKPLSFSTTMRNPNRIVSFLNCLLPYENQILTHDVIMKVIHNVIKEKIYKPVIINRISDLTNIYKSEDEKFSNKQIENIIDMSPQKHKEAGFDYGWDSRFDTIFKLPMEFGFVNYAIGKPIRISTTGHMLVDALNEEEPNEEKIRAVFLNSMMRYQSDNPYRKNANSNVPLILLLQVLKILKADADENGAGVFRQELSLFICWPNNDAIELYKKIKEIRSDVGYSYSDEYIYEICLELLGATDEQRNRFKMSQICGEAVDEYIRKMRTTGIISLRGNGRFIDYNTWEIEKLEYILDKYSEYKSFESKEEYFDYMGSVDTSVISMESSIPLDTTDIRRTTLIKIASEYTKETIYNELHKVCNKSASSDYMMKLLPGPARLEFLTSIAMVQNFDNLDVVPNYSIDDEGLPTNTAAGGKADIVCFDTVSKSLIEVSLMCGRQDQVNNEIVPIRRHLIEERKNFENTFSVFVAPFIHSDTKEIAKWYKYKENLDILTYAIDEFIEKLISETAITALLKEV